MGHTGRWPSEGRDRDGNTLHQLGDLWSLWELGEPRKDPLLRCQSSADTLILDFWPSDQQDRKFLLFEIIQLVVLCYRSPRGTDTVFCSAVHVSYTNIVAARPLVWCPGFRQKEEKGWEMKNTCQGSLPSLKELSWKPPPAISASISSSPPSAGISENAVF